MKYIIQKFTLTLDNNTGETGVSLPLSLSLLTARQFLMQLAKQWAGLQVIRAACLGQTPQLIWSLSRPVILHSRLCPYRYSDRPLESTDQTIKSKYRPIMIGCRSIGASLIITGHFDRQVLNLPFFNTFYQLKNGNYRLTETLPTM